MGVMEGVEGSLHGELRAAREGGPWSFAGLVMGLVHVVDDQGRALHERRAPVEHRRQAPLELVPCPYADERRGGAMNSSALEQMNPLLGEVMKDITAFRNQLPRPPGSWEPMFLTVLDQLARPAAYLLACERPHEPIPALVAVSHKLAAGFYGALVRLLRAEARGVAPQLSPEAFLAFVHQERALVGASEVCAGPPQMIERFTQLLLLGRDREGPGPDPTRLPVARALARQVATGILFGLADTRLERRLLPSMEGLTTRSAFLERKLEARLAELQAAPPDPAPMALFSFLADHGDTLPPGIVAGTATPEPALVALVEELVARGEGALRIEEAGRRRQMVESLAGFVALRREVLAAQWRLEAGIRVALGVASSPMTESPMILPKAKTELLLEAVTGHRLLGGPAERPELCLRNHRRNVAVPSPG